MLKLTGSDLEAAAQGVITDFFAEYRHTGVTCDFGGIAMLVEQNRTITDDDSSGYDDDSYYTIVNKGPPVSRFAAELRCLVSHRINPFASNVTSSNIT